MDIIQIGNDINHGILWPAGQIYRQDGEHKVEFADLLSAGVSGAKGAGQIPPPRVMLHAATGGDGENLSALASHYGKDILVVETAYPWTLANGDTEPNIVSDASSSPEAELFPASKQGPLDYFEAVRTVLSSVPGGRGAGFVAGEPGWLRGVPAAPGVGNAYDNLTMFDSSGLALPVCRALRA